MEREALSEALSSEENSPSGEIPLRFVPHGQERMVTPADRAEVAALLPPPTAPATTNNEESP